MMKKIIALLIALLTVIGISAQKIYKQRVLDENGKQVSLKQYKGKVLLIVNTATRCGFTPQYEELEKLYEQCRDRGLEILDFPCNQFGGQAPGTYEEIHNFCTGTYNIQFTQFDKVDVNGENQSPLFAYLKAEQPFKGFGTDERALMMDKMLRRQDPDYASKSDIKWNFTKFLVDRKGRVVRRFEPTESMEAVGKAVEALL